MLTVFMVLFCAAFFNGPSCMGLPLFPPVPRSEGNCALYLLAMRIVPMTPATPAFSRRPQKPLGNALHVAGQRRVSNGVFDFFCRDIGGEASDDAPSRVYVPNSAAARPGLRFERPADGACHYCER